MATTAFLYLESRDRASTSWVATKLNDYRDYRVYDALAGGRNFTASLYPPRGLPVDMSDTVLKQACFRITEIEEELKSSKSPERVVLKQKSMAPPFGELISRDGAEYYYPWYSFNHSHTWLMHAEIMASLAEAQIDLDQLDPFWRSLFEQMRNLEAAGHQARLVIWFGDGPRETAANKVSCEIGQVLWWLWGILDYTQQNLYGKLPLYFCEATVSIFKILATSRSCRSSRRELVHLLNKTEKDVLKVKSSPKGRLRSAVAKLLKVDVRFPNGLATTPIPANNAPPSSV